MQHSKFNQALENIKLFFQGFFDLKGRSTAIIEKEAAEEMDNFLLLCFSDLLGVPNPVSYYTLELLPYIAEEMDEWEVRVMGRKSVLADRAGRYDMDP